MKGNYPDDNFTETDVLRELELAGLRYRSGARYILTQCPTHEDTEPSAQIYKDDWFVNCHATCGRFHITKAFPTLRKDYDGKHPVRNQLLSRSVHGSKSKNISKDSQSKVMEHKYTEVDLTEFWQSLPEIPNDHLFKGIPIQILHDLGWRYDPNGDRYFIPYFSSSRTKIPFAQWRNLASGPRFNFWKDTKPTCYGTWNIDNSKLFIVEGTSDCAVLEYCSVPYIGLPSAASRELMVTMATYCKENGIQLVYAGDNDSAGDKLREALNEVTTYRLKQPPKKYKDWGDFLEAEGFETVQNYAYEELFPTLIEPLTPKQKEDLENVQEVFPGAQQLEIVGAP